MRLPAWFDSPLRKTLIPQRKMLFLAACLVLNSAGVKPSLGATVVPHFDMNELNQYQDSLSDDDFATFSERARQIESNVQSGAMSSIDGREYRQAIKELKDNIKQKMEERKGELDQQTTQVNDEFERVNRTFNTYDKDFSDEQRNEFNKRMDQLVKQWKEPGGQRKGINQGLKECDEMMQNLKHMNDSIIEASMTNKPATNIDDKESFIHVRDWNESGDSWSDFAEVRQRMPFFDYRYSPLTKSTAGVAPDEEAVLLRKRLTVLRDIKLLGTLEFDALSRELAELTDMCSRLKSPDGRYTQKNEQILKEKLNAVEHSIQKAAAH